MMAEPNDPVLARKLDAFTVPPLPAGFADAVLARAMALPYVPKLRRPARGRWWRAGSAGMGIIAAGMISVAAAASGWLGEPLRVAVTKAPLIGAVIARVSPPPAPSRLPIEAAKPRLAAPAAGTQTPEPALPVDVAASAPPRLRERLEAMSPQERQAWLEAHPVAARRIERRRDFIETHPEAAQKLADLRAQRLEAREAGATPREMRRLRRELREVRRKQLVEPKPVMQTAPVAERIAEPPVVPPVDQPAEMVADTQAAAPGAPALQRRLERRERIQERRERRRQRMQP